MRNKAKERYEDAHAQGYTKGYNDAHSSSKSARDFYYSMWNLPESFTFMGKTYHKEEETKIDPWGGCACGSSSTCDTTFTVDKSGVIDRPNLTEGRYTVLIKKETNTL